MVGNDLSLPLDNVAGSQGIAANSFSGNDRSLPYETVLRH
jgi:hypothetical protein